MAYTGRRPGPSQSELYESGGALENHDEVTVDASGNITATSYSGDGTSLTGIDALPDQTGHSGKYLNTDGTDASWSEIAGGGPSLGTDSIIRTNAQTISENITIPVGTNGMSIGDITVADGYTVTVNGRWVVI